MEVKKYFEPQDGTKMKIKLTLAAYDVTKSETRQTLNTFEHVRRRLIVNGILLPSCSGSEMDFLFEHVTNLVASLTISKPWIVLLVVAFHTLPVVSLS